VNASQAELAEDYNSLDRWEARTVDIRFNYVINFATFLKSLFMPESDNTASMILAVKTQSPATSRRYSIFQPTFALP
jgi:hypothetical protein